MCWPWSSKEEPSVVADPVNMHKCRLGVVLGVILVLSTGNIIEQLIHAFLGRLHGMHTPSSSADLTHSIHPLYMHVRNLCCSTSLP